MKCPNCGKETNKDKNYCEMCGYALYGPQSILLNETEVNSNIDKDNIKSITGIDINSINNTSAYTPDFKPSFEKEPDEKKEDDDIYFEKRDKSRFDFKWIIILIFIVVIAVLGYMVYTSTRDNDTGVLNKPTEVIKKEYEGFKVTTPSYAFDLPKRYDYYSSGDILIISGNSFALNVYPLASGKIDTITSSTIKDQYNIYNGVNISENIVNRRKLITVAYNEGDQKYMDLYFQFDGERVMYARAISKGGNGLEDKDLNNIISSFTINGTDNKLTFEESNFDFDLVLSLLK